ncbi:hypothetical protein chiPu_0003502 [Chiloscyllium punctatum]|uniref:Uncharacterized protein n=1 Tax=Chiloscyllium punctatum TaxID=137246 RepID=A0A401S3W4_CHIPU|nr:hypothetical protein [Chiloscyllium punctatum]
MGAAGSVSSEPYGGINDGEYVSAETLYTRRGRTQFYRLQLRKRAAFPSPGTGRVSLPLSKDPSERAFSQEKSKKKKSNTATKRRLLGWSNSPRCI